MAEEAGEKQVPGIKDTSKKTVTSAERIHQLNEIDKDVANLLQAAGQAVKSLTTTPPEELFATKASPVNVNKAAFTTATTTYFALLQSISQRLKIQIDALEQAKIIAPRPPIVDRGPEANKPGAEPPKVSTVTGTGLGSLDVGWLNSNISDAVGREMEGELWAKAREFLEGLEKARAADEEDIGGRKTP